jgi:hypothetical protein
VFSTDAARRVFILACAESRGSYSRLRCVSLRNPQAYMEHTPFTHSSIVPDQLLLISDGGGFSRSEADLGETAILGKDCVLCSKERRFSRVRRRGEGLRSRERAR